MSDSMQKEFAPGSDVVYGIHGRCQVEGIIDRSVDGKTIRFYKLQIQRPPLSRSKRKEPAIWLPVDAATSRGLREPITKDDIQSLMEVFSSAEYYFDPSMHWKEVLPKLEETINLEGSVGLAKVESFLFVLKAKQIVPTPEVSRFSEMVHRILVREIAETLGDSIKSVEDRIDKIMQQKLAPVN